jgi:peptidoglycan biosynthesis protein MviN/MurJ (putative lipid II flippase)
VSDTRSSTVRRRIGDRIILGGIIVGLASMLVRLSAFAYRWVLLHTYGGGEAGRLFTDAHFYALGSVFAVYALAQQSIAPAFLPVFMSELNRPDTKGAWRFASAVMLAVVAMALGIGVLAMLVPDGWCKLSELITGETVAPQAGDLLRAQIPLLAPAFVAIAASVVTYMILNGHKRFFWAQAAEGVMRLVTVGAMVYAFATGLTGTAAAAAVAVGVSIGCVARLATHLAAMGRDAFAFGRPEFASPAARRFAWLIAPLLVGIVLAQVRDFINNFAVLLPLEGLVTANGNGRTLYTSMANLVPWALGVAMFPYFCELVDRNDLAALGRILTRSGRVLALAFFAFAGSVAVMSRPFMYVIYGTTGGLDPADLDLAALANSCYILVLPAYALEKLVLQGFFANRKMVAPTLLGLAFSFISMGISVVGIRVFGLTGAAALATVALGYTASRCLKTVVLIAVLKRSVPMFPTRESIVFFAKAALVAVAAAGSAYLVRIVYESGFGLEAALERGARAVLVRVGLEIALCGAASIVSALVAIKLLGLPELGWIVEWVRKRRTRGAADGEPPD